jgi:hypothetical protein
VLLQNHGTESLYSVDIFIHIIGTGVDIVFKHGWVNPSGLSGGSYEEVLFDDKFDFSDGLYSLKAWTESPNGQPDCNFFNDTTEVSVVASLCGTEYTIGGQDADFSNFSDAISVINTCGNYLSCCV